MKAKINNKRDNRQIITGGIQKYWFLRNKR